MDSPIILPFTLWSSSKPSFSISSICVTPNFEKLLTGSVDGQLCVWDLNLKKEEIIPKIVLIGHESSVTCVVSTNDFVISSSEGGEMCRWNIEDGYCEKAKNLMYVHRNAQLFKQSLRGDELLFTCGDYSNIFIYHSVSLQKLCSLYCEKDFSWISNFHVATLQNDNGFVVSGITFSGGFKSWTIDNSLKESQSETNTIDLPIEEVVDLKYNRSQLMMLIVTVRYWCLFDSQLFNCIQKESSVNKERLLGGHFCNLNVAVWTNSGKFYLYAEKDKHQKLVTVLWNESSKLSLFQPAMTIAESGENEKYFFKGDSYGNIRIWKLEESNKESDFPFVSSLISAGMSDRWISEKNGFFESFISFSKVTCCDYAFELDKFFLGCSNGKIACVPASQAIMSFHFRSSFEKPCYDFLSGHKGRVNCLLYPRGKYGHYNREYLVSGGKDFSVCLWDVFKLELLHRFSVQVGEILRLIVPPENCSLRVRNSVCSVSSDNSVAVLNLTKKRCVILASRHSFPVVSVNWRPSDDFLIIECFDGTVYVWETETGFLERVLHGVVAQEVVYACNENNFATPVNFYTSEKLIRLDSMERKVFQIRGETTDHPFALAEMRASDESESPIFSCNLNCLMEKIVSGPDERDADSCRKLYFLTTKAMSSEQLSRKPPYVLLEKLRENFFDRIETKENDAETDDGEPEVQNDRSGSSVVDVSDDKILPLVKFYLSSLHAWDSDSALDEILASDLGLVKPDVPPSPGIVSAAGNYSLFLPTEGKIQRSSRSLLAFACIAMTSLSKALKSIRPFSFGFSDAEDVPRLRKKSWKQLYSFYEGICLDSSKETVLARPRLEVLAKAWQTGCLPLRNVVRKLLPSHLEALVDREHDDLLKFWYEFLPNLRESGRFDTDLESIALVLFGTVGTDLKFKNYSPQCQEIYVRETSSSLMDLLLARDDGNDRLRKLQEVAIGFIGRGYIVWEPFLKIENVFPVLFRMSENVLKFRFRRDVRFTESSDTCLAAYEALKSIAIARTSAFVKFLTDEIDRIRSPQTGGNEIFSIENLKPEILSIATFLLEETPYIMLLYLNEIVSIFIYCIDSSHLKRENLTDLIPIVKKFRQVHHSVTGQRVAVGLATGSILVHDLKTGKTISVSAHEDSVTAIKFSDDGKFLASYSCYENRISFWQFLTGIFGLGQAHMKSVKSYRTHRIRDEEIRNHLQIAELSWEGNKSVLLTLCDGTEAIFHS